jgi:hypothetical protein
LPVPTAWTAIKTAAVAARRLAIRQILPSMVAVSQVLRSESSDYKYHRIGERVNEIPGKAMRPGTDRVGGLARSENGGKARYRDQTKRANRSPSCTPATAVRLKTGC